MRVLAIIRTRWLYFENPPSKTMIKHFILINRKACVQTALTISAKHGVAIHSYTKVVFITLRKNLWLPYFPFRCIRIRDMLNRKLIKSFRSSVLNLLMKKYNLNCVTNYNNNISMFILKLLFVYVLGGTMFLGLRTQLHISTLVILSQYDARKEKLMNRTIQTNCKDPRSLPLPMNRRNFRLAPVSIGEMSQAAMLVTQ